MELIIVMKECRKCNIQYDDMLTFCRNCNGPLKTVSDDISGENTSQLICNNCKTANPQDYMYCKKCAEPLRDQVADINIASTASVDNVDKASNVMAVDKHSDKSHEESSDEKSIKDSSHSVETKTATDTKNTNDNHDKVSSGNNIFKVMFVMGVIAIFVVVIIYYNNSNNNKEVTAQSPAPSPTAKTNRHKANKTSKAKKVTTTAEETGDNTATQNQTQSIRPSFDCRKASTTAERLICSNNELAQADVQMAQAYFAARANAPNKAAFIREQAAWLKNQRNVCVDANTMLQVYTERISQLSR